MSIVPTASTYPGTPSDDAADPLERFRPKGQPRHVLRDKAQVYRAFTIEHARQLRIKVCPASGPLLRLSYPYLQSIEEDPLGTQLVLSYSFLLVVIITGHSLSSLAEALSFETCSSIQQFRPDLWPNFEPSQAPHIDKIQVLTIIKQPS